MSRKDRKVPKGSKDRETVRNAGSSAGNGSWAVNFPASRKGSEEGSLGPNGPEAGFSGASKGAGQELQSWRGGSETDSRFRGAKGRSEALASSATPSAGFPSFDPLRRKRHDGERRRRERLRRRCQVRAEHAGWRTSCHVGHLEPFLFGRFNRRGRFAGRPRRFFMTRARWRTSVSEAERRRSRGACEFGGTSPSAAES